MTVELFDHWSDQEHESVAAFLENWGERPWDDANVPVGLFLKESAAGELTADFLVFLPRKEHVKHVRVRVREGELARLRETLRGVGEGIFGPAAAALERFAAGEEPRWEGEFERGAAVLYYWEAKEDSDGGVQD